MAVTYRSLITSKFRTQNLLHFYNMVGDEVSPAPESNEIYLSMGKETPWAANETSHTFAPPYPIDTSDGVIDVWTNMTGVVKVKKEYFDAVIPRKDWGDISYDSPNRFHINEIIVVNSAPFNQTDPGRGMIVYRCVDIPSNGACSISTIDNKVDCLRVGGIWEPETTSQYPPRGNGDAVDMGDGYLWEYLYTIPNDVSINRVTNEYIVVPFPQDVDNDPTRWGLDHILSGNMNPRDLIYRVKCSVMRFRAYLDSIFFPEASLPGNDGFRQMSIIMNPILAKEKESDPDVKATNESYDKGDLEVNSGEMIYIENRQKIIRSLDQVEEVSILFDF